MDLKVLQFKNKKLAERLEQRQAFEDELRERIEKLEKRQATDDATLLIVNRYWKQVRLPSWLIFLFKFLVLKFADMRLIIAPVLVMLHEIIMAWLRLSCSQGMKFHL